MLEILIPVEPEVNRIFSTLRGFWKAQNPTKRYQDLADELSEFLGIKVTPQKLAQWATGSDHRRPQWNAIYFLMAKTGYDVKLSVHGAKLVKVVKAPRDEEVPALDYSEPKEGE